MLRYRTIARSAPSTWSTMKRRQRPAWSAPSRSRRPAGRRPDPHRRHRRPGPAGVRRHAPHLNRPCATNSHPEDRQQGPAEPAPSDRIGENMRHEGRLGWVSDRGLRSRHICCRWRSRNPPPLRRPWWITRPRISTPSISASCAVANNVKVRSAFALRVNPESRNKRKPI